MGHHILGSGLVKMNQVPAAAEADKILLWKVVYHADQIAGKTTLLKQFEGGSAVKEINYIAKLTAG